VKILSCLKLAGRKAGVDSYPRLLGLRVWKTSGINLQSVAGVEFAWCAQKSDAGLVRAWANVNPRDVCLTLRQQANFT